MSTFSVIIPAHNEAAVIGRCLRSLSAASTKLGEIVVVCNGCDDGTREAALEAAPDIRVIEVAKPSKVGALNAGDAVTSFYPRFYVDADVELAPGSLDYLLDVLSRGEALAVAPRISFELSGCSIAVRQFYKIWQKMPYLNDRMVGSGFFGLSEEGRRRFGLFPDVTADDQFVMQQFSFDERRTVHETSFIVRPPRTLRSLVKVRTRAYRGDRQLQRSGLAAAPRTGGALQGILALEVSARLSPALAVYLTVNAVAKLLARQSSPVEVWERDDSARTTVTVRRSKCFWRASKR